MWRELLLVARKEFRAFFASAAAWLFLAAWLVATLFVFFWVETFFARNLADVRPLFTWLPRLMIFLVAALTMRAWSEERRGGTLETLLTSPVRPASLVLGKFLAVLGLVGVALALTLPIPIVVAQLGRLDWGPVAGGYVAALLLAAAYAAVGLWSSARTDNPIVALIVTTLVCGLLWAVGAPMVTNLFGHPAGGVLALLGTGRRFESILRGVLDLRDLAYFASIVGVFLTLNLLQLERLRWAGNPARPAHRRAVWLAGLLAANFAAANLWLAHVPWARVDLTRGGQYTLSAATRSELGKLREPLLLRGYFSARTHPLLAPLVPQLQDVLREYGVAGGDRVRVEFVDPQGDQAAEEEAASRFGVRPTPFQTADRYQAAVVSSYFDVVVAYGDQHVVLGFRDLVEVKFRGTEIDVVLRDPEYLLTGAVRKAVTGYRGGGSPFDALDAPVAFKAYVSAPQRLPPVLRTLRADLEAVLAELGKQAGAKLTVAFHDPDDDGGKVAGELRQRHGLAPMVASLADPRPFWFSMVLEGKGETVPLPIPEKLDRESLKKTIQAGVQRLAPGVLRTVGLVTPPGDPRYGGSGYSILEKVLAQEARVQPVSLDSGRVPEDVDVLVVLAPRTLGEPQRFAIDQFLMRGGSVVLATSPFDVQLQGGVTAGPASSGLEEWLAGHGVTIGKSFVLDPQSTALPVPVQRFAGGLAIQEVQLVPYPHFPDLREGGLDRSHPTTAALGQLTVPWASPIELDAKKLEGRTVAKLLQSSAESWTSESTNVVPDWGVHPETGFDAPATRAAKVLAVAVEGPFDSAFEGKTPPAPAAGAEATPASVLERSPAGARLVVVASNEFASDESINLLSEGLRSLYLKPIELLQNAVDWSVEDPALLALRGRSRFAATLVPLQDGARRGWEYATYALVLAALGAVFGWRKAVARADRRRHALVLQEVKP
ncbi:MAG TPA: Gldg family protein [Anaeromyxobacter sp.]|nr:Gldg family protein [Anaeromyxobacter sp.]